MSKAVKYINKVSEITSDEFDNFIGLQLSDHEAFIAIKIHELEILEDVEALNINVKERIKELRNQLKHIKYD